MPHNLVVWHFAPVFSVPQWFFLFRDGYASFRPGFCGFAEEYAVTPRFLSLRCGYFPKTQPIRNPPVRAIGNSSGATIKP